ncbi:hypothetical protein TNCV_1149181 [Trichonephila clavipes]|nr:hypothetical protein TNCV_1149181 [Trichonephila clavipes]
MFKKRHDSSRQSLMLHNRPKYVFTILEQPASKELTVKSRATYLHIKAATVFWINGSRTVRLWVSLTSCLTASSSPYFHKVPSRLIMETVILNEIKPERICVVWVSGDRGNNL